jgi:hypothetical protein
VVRKAIERERESIEELLAAAKREAMVYLGEVVRGKVKAPSATRLRAIGMLLRIVDRGDRRARPRGCPRPVGKRPLAFRELATMDPVTASREARASTPTVAPVPLPTVVVPPAAPPAEGVAEEGRTAAEQSWAFLDDWEP